MMYILFLFLHICVSAAHGLLATPKRQTLSPAPGMAPSPGTLLPQLPLHGHHMAQASLINSPQASIYIAQYMP